MVAAEFLQGTERARSHAHERTNGFCTRRQYGRRPVASAGGTDHRPGGHDPEDA